MIKAHIIPRSFFKPLRKGETPARLLSQNGYPKKSPIGVYNKTILCYECEKKFQIWDDYAQYILLQKVDKFIPRTYHDRLVGYEIKDFDYLKLKLFFLSILWRASVSNYEFYALVDLGESEDVVKNLIKNEDPGHEDDFSIILACFNNRIGKLSMLNPRSQVFDGVNFFQFYLAGVIAYIKNDKRTLINDLRKFQMTPGQNLVMIIRDFNESKERKLLENIVRSTTHFNEAS